MNENRKIKSIRIALRLKQRQFAEYLGVGDTAVSNWEKGTTRFPINKRSVLYKALNVNPRWFESEDDETDEQTFGLERLFEFVSVLYQSFLLKNRFDTTRFLQKIDDRAGGKFFVFPQREEFDVAKTRRIRREKRISSR